MRFAVVNDVHVGLEGSGYCRGVQRKLVGEADRLLARFVRDMNEIERPQFVVNLGDLIEDAGDPEVAAVLLRRAGGLLSQLAMPCHSLIGNHDVRTLSHSEAATILGLESCDYSFDVDDFHFVALGFELVASEDGLVSSGSVAVSKEQLCWLGEDLRATEKPTVIFSHYGISDDSMEGNFWFAAQPEQALISNRREVRACLERSGKVKAVISAHQHWNRMLVHADIPYMTVTSLVENTHSDGVPTEAYSLVDLDRVGMTLDVHGNDPARFRYRFRASTICR